MDFKFLPIAYFEDKFMDFKDAKLSVATHALHYGTGAFGGMRGIPDPSNPNSIILFRLEDHAKRLSNSAKILKYDLSAEKIQDILIKFVQKNKPQTSFYIRPLVYTSGLGIAPKLHDHAKDFLIYGLELGDYLNPDGVSVCFSSWFRYSDSSIPTRGKITGTYINSSLAKTEAVERGYDEALLMNHEGNVTEASGMNLFMYKNRVLVTPGYNQDILEGITRDSLIKVANNLGIEVVQRPIAKSELIIADEVFLTGTAAKVAPVKQIEGYKTPTNRPITEKLMQVMTDISKGKNPDYEDWLTRIEI